MNACARLLFLALGGAAVGLSACTGSIGGAGESGDSRSGGTNQPGTPGQPAIVPTLPDGTPIPGQGTDPGVISTPDGLQGYACDAAAVPGSAPLRRLTRVQYGNTLRDLLTFALKDATTGNTAFTTLAAKLDSFPPDTRVQTPADSHGTYRRLDQAMSQTIVNATYDIAATVGTLLTSSKYLGAALGTCATDGMPANDATCVSSFIQRFGERAMRRPLGSDETTFFQSIYGSPAAFDAAALTDVVTVILSAPQFLYEMEHGAANLGPNSASLSAYELASRLSYQFWNTTPDDTLLASAKSGALTQPGELQNQLTRLLADPRARSATTDFYREWLKLEEKGPLDQRNQDTLFKTFAADNLPSANLGQAMMDEVLAMTGASTWDKPASVADVLSSQSSYAKSPELAKLYGVAAWDGTSTPPAFPSGQRPGLFTRAAFLATGSANSRPIMRGVFMRKVVLCDEIPPPPGNAAATPPTLDPNSSTRDIVIAKTETVGGACAACHATLINPIGFAFEGFDALGRVRTEERLFSTTGQESGRVAIDTTSVPAVVVGDPTPSTGVGDLMDLVRKSGKVQGCLARNYLRYTFGRWDDVPTDGCLLERLRAKAASGTLRDVVQEIALAPEFRQRSFD